MPSGQIPMLSAILCNSKFCIPVRAACGAADVVGLQVVVNIGPALDGSAVADVMILVCCGADQQQQGQVKALYHAAIARKQCRPARIKKSIACNIQKGFPIPCAKRTRATSALS